MLSKFRTMSLEDLRDDQVCMISCLFFLLLFSNFVRETSLAQHYGKLVNLCVSW